jgi:hypothetical protein
MGRRPHPNLLLCSPPLLALTLNPSVSSSSMAPGTTATLDWKAALPRLMRRNLSSSGARATLPGRARVCVCV